MTLTVASSVDLAKRLRELDDSSLRYLLNERLSDIGSLKDYFDVADALLSTASLERAFRQLTTDELIQLQELSRAPGELLSYAHKHVLTIENGHELYPEISEFLHNLTLIPPAPQGPGERVEGLPAQAALEHAFTHITALDDVLYDLERTPLKTLSNRNPSSKDIVRLSTLIPSDTDLVSLLHLGEEAGLAYRSAKWWAVTKEYVAWQELSLEDKWLSCTQSWLDHLDWGIRTVLGNAPTLPPTDAWLVEQFPLGHSWMSQPLTQALQSARILGLMDSNSLTTSGAAVLSEDWASASTLVTRAAPRMVDTVFIQHDFTVIAQGPLVPELNQFMRMLCTVESRGVASTYRITPEGIDSLLGRGWSAEKILTRLSEVSSTEIPQAVTYFITERAERFGSITVTSRGDSTVITCRDELSASMLLHDRNVRMLRLTAESPQSLTCSHPVHVVVRTLREAKYSPTVEDGTVSSTPTFTTSSEDTGPIQVLFSRLRSLENQEMSDEASWLGRQLDLALRQKIPVWVSVNMPDGPKDFLVDIKGIANGRVRCLDRHTEVERTLPASHITAVTRQQ